MIRVSLDQEDFSALVRGREVAANDPVTWLLNIPVVLVAIVLAALVASAFGTSTRASVVAAIVVFLVVWIGGNYAAYRLLYPRGRR